MEHDIDKVVRTHSRAEERDVGHIGNVGDRHPDGRVAGICEGLRDVGGGKAILHKRAAKGVVVIVQTEEFKTSSLCIEKPNGSNQQKNRQNVFLHAG